MKNILILGFGVSGQAAARLAAFGGAHVSVLDEHPLKLPADAAYTLLPAWTPGTPVGKYDEAVISPGISIRSPLAEAVRRSGTPIRGELEFASEGLPCKVVAITGTNGKTTTTELTAELLKNAGYRCEAAGNIGTALSDVALEIKKGLRKIDVLVVETSSFQLESMERFSPFSAALLNLASDHIDRHGTMKDYADVKFRLFRDMYRTERNCAVSRSVMREWIDRYPEDEPSTFAADGKYADFHLCGDMICFRNNPILGRKACPPEGVHNTENILAALALFRTVAGDTALFSEPVKRTLSGFRPDGHRIECFAERNGIRFIDDSKATNPHSVNAALRTAGGAGNVHLLLGGLDKDMDFSCIAEESGRIHQAYLYGQSAGKIEETLGGKIPCRRMESFESAVREACRNAVPGEVVMLSPACASFDLFSGYKARGERFQALVREYLNR